MKDSWALPVNFKWDIKWFWDCFASFLMERDTDLVAENKGNDRENLNFDGKISEEIRIPLRFGACEVPSGKRATTPFQSLMQVLQCCEVHSLCHENCRCRSCWTSKQPTSAITDPRLVAIKKLRYMLQRHVTEDFRRFTTSFSAIFQAHFTY